MGEFPSNEGKFPLWIDWFVCNISLNVLLIIIIIYVSVYSAYLFGVCMVLIIKVHCHEIYFSNFFFHFNFHF